MQDLSLHILDVAENAIRSGARRIRIAIVEDAADDVLVLSIEDDGVGMDEDTVKNVLDPFYTTKEGKRVGLGLSLLAQAAQATGGDMKIESTPSVGTSVTAEFKSGHPDMKPMGDVLETMAALVMGNPEIRFVFDCEQGDEQYHFDSSRAKGSRVDADRKD
jgi:anti-sigma regulatory factor (Ser/Thr protein kinase)